MQPTVVNAFCKIALASFCSSKDVLQIHISLCKEVQTQSNWMENICDESLSTDSKLSLARRSTKPKYTYVYKNIIL